MFWELSEVRNPCGLVKHFNLIEPKRVNPRFGDELLGAIWNYTRFQIILYGTPY